MNKNMALSSSCSGPATVQVVGMSSVGEKHHPPVRTMSATKAVLLASGSVAKQRRMEEAHTALFSQPESLRSGTNLMSQLKFAIDLLKATTAGGQTMVSIVDRLGLGDTPEANKRALTERLRTHPRVVWTSGTGTGKQTTWRTGTYAYLAAVPGVTDADSLLAFLWRRSTRVVTVRDLKDGWPDCEDALALLEQQHKIFMTTRSKSRQWGKRSSSSLLPRHVWLDDPSLYYEIEPEFAALWPRVEVPSTSMQHEKLWKVELAGGEEAEAAGRKKKPEASKVQKKKKKACNKSGGLQTNAHLMHLLQDYSHLRR
ncbi:Transcription initiation factor beta subunit [Cordyceps militaris]|uniref:Transcription initiation factor IIE subunit beta n=1 Tax=Cordyceps militaris TaxID=73501 RepID=A0A2H4SR51_CORMI|nr:Transcription initiation factor beta subunit [Cordyceps militaris]